MNADQMRELFDIYKDLIDDQTEYADELASELKLFGASNFKELNGNVILDVLSYIGLQLVPIDEENIPSLAVLRPHLTGLVRRDPVGHADEDVRSIRRHHSARRLR